KMHLTSGGNRLLHSIDAQLVSIHSKLCWDDLCSQMLQDAPCVCHNLRYRLRKQLIHQHD
ncbi:unnamed protein product, partial [Ceratitis capitata]